MRTACSLFVSNYNSFGECQTVYMCNFSGKYINILMKQKALSVFMYMLVSSIVHVVYIYRFGYKVFGEKKTINDYSICVFKIN